MLIKVPSWNFPSLEKTEGIMGRTNILRKSRITHGLLVNKGSKPPASRTVQGRRQAGNILLFMKLTSSTLKQYRCWVYHAREVFTFQDVNGPLSLGNVCYFTTNQSHFLRLWPLCLVIFICTQRKGEKNNHKMMFFKVIVQCPGKMTDGRTRCPERQGKQEEHGHVPNTPLLWNQGAHQNHQTVYCLSGAIGI